MPSSEEIVYLNLFVCLHLKFRVQSFLFLLSFFSKGQVMYSASSGYVMTQVPCDVPVAIPMQSEDGRVALQTVTPGVQESEPQIVLVPVSVADEIQPQLVQIAPYGITASGYQPQHIDIPPSYEEGQYATQQRQQV